MMSSALILSLIESVSHLLRSFLLESCIATVSCSFSRRQLSYLFKARPFGIHAGVDWLHESLQHFLASAQVRVRGVPSEDLPF